MAEYKRCVVDANLKGDLAILDEVNNFPARNARRAFLTPYALLEQNWPELHIYLGLQIRTDADAVCVAYQEMEAFIRALAIEHNVCVTVPPLPYVTDDPAKWPKGISFLKAHDFPICSEKWEPLNHYKNPKNRLRGVISGFIKGAGQLSPILEGKHAVFCGHTKYKSALVEDYLAGLDAEFSHPSVAMLYFAKVLERVGKEQYGGAENKFLDKKVLKNLLVGLGLTDKEKSDALEQIPRWRHKRSEAHLVTEGQLVYLDLLLCKKVARLVLERALSP